MDLLLKRGLILWDHQLSPVNRRHVPSCHLVDIFVDMLNLSLMLVYVVEINLHDTNKDMLNLS